MRSQKTLIYSPSAMSMNFKFLDLAQADRARFWSSSNTSSDTTIFSLGTLSALLRRNGRCSCAAKTTLRSALSMLENSQC